VSQEKQSHTGEDMKSQCAFRLKARDGGKAVASWKKVNGPLHSIVVDGSNSKCNYISTMEDL